MVLHTVESESDFNMKVGEAGDKIVIVDFSASWCGPCKIIGPYFKTLAEEFPNIVALNVDVDDVEEIAAKFSIEAMPTFIALKNGKEVARVMGASKDKVKELFTNSY